MRIISNEKFFHAAVRVHVIDDLRMGMNENGGEG